MKVQHIIALVKKDIKKILRQPANLFLAILFPLILTGAFGIAFGSLGGDNSNTTFTVGIVNHDNGVWSNYFDGNLSESGALVGAPYQDMVSAQEAL